MKILATLALVCAAPAVAQPQCLPRPNMMEMLADQFHEARQSMALSMGGSVIEVFANLQTGTWTAVETMPDGMACIVSFGDNYQVIAEPQGVDG